MNDDQRSRHTDAHKGSQARIRARLLDTMHALNSSLGVWDERTQ
ncbi:hypothetical protein ACVH9Z_34280 [Rhodococcus opacus]|nr:hypothetical protein [Rhodococcus opacus]